MAEKQGGHVLDIKFGMRLCMVQELAKEECGCFYVGCRLTCAAWQCKDQQVVAWRMVFNGGDHEGYKREGCSNVRMVREKAVAVCWIMQTCSLLV